MRRRLSLTAALVLLLSLLCACAAQHAQEMDENGYARWRPKTVSAR